MVECAGLENRYGVLLHRGFESPPLRRFILKGQVLRMRTLGHTRTEVIKVKVKRMQAIKVQVRSLQVIKG